LNGYYSITTGYKKSEIFYIGIGGLDVNRIIAIKGKFSLKDTASILDETFTVNVVNRTTGDTLDIVHPDKNSGLYSLSVPSGEFRVIYTGRGYLSQTIDTALAIENPSQELNLDITLEMDTSVYERINLAKIPVVSDFDSSTLIRNMNVNDLNDKNINDDDVLYYTVQVIALYNPVDISHFKYIPDIEVMYNDKDKFYRYTTGRFSTREEADLRKVELIRKGYPEEIFIKKVSKQ
jgi:hypothetical protein